MVSLIGWNVACAAGGEPIVTTGREALGTVAREDTDATLVARAQNGDVGAFGELVGRHQRAVYGVVSRMISDRDDTDDVVQDVFVTAYKSIAAFKGQAAFATWLYRIAVNTAIKQMRKAKIRQSTSIDDPLTGLGDLLVSNNGDGPERAAELGERNEAVRNAIRGLPEKHQAVVVLHYFESLSCDEIAKILECSVGTVWSRLHYACKKMQGQLDWLKAG